VGWGERVLLAVPILYADHLPSHGLPAPGLPPEIGACKLGHKEFERPRALHLLADYINYFSERPKAKRKVQVHACGFLSY